MCWHRFVNKTHASFDVFSDACWGLNLIIWPLNCMYSVAQYMEMCYFNGFILPALTKDTGGIWGQVYGHQYTLNRLHAWEYDTQSWTGYSSHVMKGKHMCMGLAVCIHDIVKTMWSTCAKEGNMYFIYMHVCGTCMYCVKWCAYTSASLHLYMHCDHVTYLIWSCMH